MRDEGKVTAKFDGTQRTRVVVVIAADVRPKVFPVRQKEKRVYVD